MKKLFTVPVNVMAYSQQDAQAKVDFLLQMGAFIKDFDLTSLGASLLNSLIISTLSEVTEKEKVGTGKNENRTKKTLKTG